MNLKLYHYVHCPFCVRVRMALSYLELPYESIVVPYDDEETPKKLTGKKMLPIMVINGNAVNESLDIIALIDEKKKFHIQEMIARQEYQVLTEKLDRLGSNIHSLAMPYWIYTPEFSESSRNYFQKKKEEKRGPFKELVKNQKKFIDGVNNELQSLESELTPYYKSQSFTIYDVFIASHLWGLYVVPEFQFTEKIHRYLQTVKSICRFNYHEDFWR